MRWVFAFLLVALLQCDARALAASPPSKVPRVQIGGREHIRFSDWAKSHGLKVRWVTWEKTIQASDSKGTVVLTVNSSLAKINGVRVWLSFPVRVRYGHVYVSSLDIRSTLDPLVAPVRSPAGKIGIVCLDPGHGGKDPGYRRGYQQEKTFTLLLAQEIKRQLLAAGVKAVLTRSGDRFVDLGERPEFARKNGAGLFVSLHFNSTEANRATVRGPEVYCLTPAGAYSTNTGGRGDADYCVGNKFNDKSVLLAYHVQKRLVEQLGSDRGVRRARFAVLRDATMPAVLVEAGFLSHPDEGRKIADAKHRQALARAITNGILAYGTATGKP